MRYRVSETDNRFLENLKIFKASAQRLLCKRSMSVST
jgi:hypothetical protein